MDGRGTYRCDETTGPYFLTDQGNRVKFSECETNHIQKPTILLKITPYSTVLNE
jgi:hypothetical protein